MSTTFTSSDSTTFTITHARHIAAKVATDLKRIQRLYYAPTDAEIAGYEAEITEFLRAGFLEKVTYGFKRDGRWIEPTLTYYARDLAGTTAADDDPGGIWPWADVQGAIFTSFLVYSWGLASSAEIAAFKAGLPFQRGTGVEPGVDGYFAADRSYSSGGKALQRSSVRGFS